MSRVPEDRSPPFALSEPDLLRAILEGAAEAIFFKDVDGRYLAINPAGASLLGRPVGEVVGRLDVEVMPPETGSVIRADDERILEGGVPVTLEQELVVDGARRTFLVTKTPWRDERGTVRGLIGVAQDIMPRKRAEAAATEAARRSAFLAEASTLLASALDYRDTLRTVVRVAVPFLADWAAADMLSDDGRLERLAMAHADPQMLEAAWSIERSYPRDSATADGIARVMRFGRPELIATVPDAMLEAIAQDAEHLRLLRAVGLRSAMVLPLVARGRTLGALAFGIAESERRFTEADLAFAGNLADRAAVAVDNARLYGQAQEANRLKDDFLATLSHELRTPLNAIVGWSDLLLSGSLDPADTRRGVETIHRNARAQNQLIGDILDVSRIMSGKLILNARPLDPTAVVDAALDTVRPAAQARGVVLEKSVTTPGAFVMGDPDRLQQVVWNLLSNAIKFSPRGTVVRVLITARGDIVEVAVQDGGAGIPSDFLPHVFERFRQGDSSSTRKHGGLGLGLAIVRHLVELHGGTVAAESPGLHQGSTFRVSLPQLASDNRRPPSAPDAPIQQSLQGIRVLCVEDDPDARELLTRLLEAQGASVDAVGSAREAFEALRIFRFDVLVSDIQMDEEDGYSLLRRIRALGSEHGGGIPAAAVTAYARTEDRVRAFLAGFQMHIAKPVQAAELTAAVATLAGRTGAA